MNTMLAVALLLCVGAAHGVAVSGGTFPLPLYQQCGGKGGACDSIGNGQCEDEAWDSTSCPSDAECVKDTPYIWMCKPATDAKIADSVTTETAAKTKKAARKIGFGETTGTVPIDGALATISDVRRDTAVEEKAQKKATEPEMPAPAPAPSKAKSPILEGWKQCGGSTADCTEYGDKACADCPFPGTFCEEGYVCARVVEYFWQCAPVGSNEPGKPSAECAALEAPSDTATVSAGGALGTSTGAPGERTCGKPRSDMEVDGEYLTSIFLDGASDGFYKSCCSECSDDDGCVAFQVNLYGTNKTTCDLFASYKKTVTASGSIAGVMLSPSETSIAG